MSGSARILCGASAVARQTPWLPYLQKVCVVEPNLDPVCRDEPDASDLIPQGKLLLVMPFLNGVLA
jgi:hypothetical protein